MGASCCKAQQTTDDNNVSVYLAQRSNLANIQYSNGWAGRSQPIVRSGSIERTATKIVPANSLLGPPITNSGNINTSGFNVYGAPVQAYVSESGRTY